MYTVFVLREECLIYRGLYLDKSCDYKNIFELSFKIDEFHFKRTKLLITKIIKDVKQQIKKRKQKK